MYSSDVAESSPSSPSLSAGGPGGRPMVKLETTSMMTTTSLMNTTSPMTTPTTTMTNNKHDLVHLVLSTFIFMLVTGL